MAVSNTFLVVDDENEAMMKRLFLGKFRKEVRRGDLTLLFANDGAEALQRLEEYPQVNVIFSDLNMPGMDGIALLKALRQHYGGQGIVSIIITAYGDYTRLRQAMNEGAFDFLSKPLSFDDLEKTLSRALKAQRHAGELEQENARLKQELQLAREKIARLETRQLTS